jgi:CopG-like RHH_1 or ribbon-helix-helix domain, RHH_5
MARGPTKKMKPPRRGNPMIRAIVSKELEAKLRERAKEERRTISQMAAILIEKGLREG